MDKDTYFKFLAEIQIHNGKAVIPPGFTKDDVKDVYKKLSEDIMERNIPFYKCTNVHFLGDSMGDNMAKVSLMSNSSGIELTMKLKDLIILDYGKYSDRVAKKGTEAKGNTYPAMVLRHEDDFAELLSSDNSPHHWDDEVDEETADDGHYDQFSLRYLDMDLPKSERMRPRFLINRRITLYDFVSDQGIVARNSSWRTIYFFLRAKGIIEYPEAQSFLTADMSNTPVRQDYYLGNYIQVRYPISDTIEFTYLDKVNEEGFVKILNDYGKENIKED